MDKVIWTEIYRRWWSPRGKQLFATQQIFLIELQVRYVAKKSFPSLLSISRPGTSSSLTSVTRKDRQMSIKVDQKMFSLVKLKILTPVQKFPENVEDLGKLIVAKGFK